MIQYPYMVGINKATANQEKWGALYEWLFSNVRYQRWAENPISCKDVPRNDGELLLFFRDEITALEFALRFK